MMAIVAGLALACIGAIHAFESIVAADTRGAIVAALVIVCGVLTASIGALLP